jgi:hypothetical protein
VTLLAIIEAVVARIAAAREEFDPLVRDQIFEDLEDDVVGWLAEYERRKAA